MTANTISKAQRTRGESYVAPTPVPKTQRTRGRPSTFDEERIPEAVELALNGATSVEIAAHFGVDPATYWRWEQAYPELRKAVRAAKDIQDARVVDALRINSVMGNVTAQIFWLKNRQPQEWRDRHETEIIVPDTSDQPALPTKTLALQMLAFLNGAMYDPEQVEPQPKTLDLTANAREETEHARTEDAGRSLGHREPSHVGGGVGIDPDFDLDPGEL